MIIPAKGRYAFCVMIDLAENNNGSYILMEEAAERQGLPFKYLARIMPISARNHVVDTIPGKSGGYRLNRKPEEYTVGEILRLIDGKFAPVACLAYGAERVNNPVNVVHFRFGKTCRIWMTAIWTALRSKI